MSAALTLGFSLWLSIRAVLVFIRACVYIYIVIVIQSGWRGMKARRRAKRRRQAADLIRRCLNETFFWRLVFGAVFCKI